MKVEEGLRIVLNSDAAVTAIALAFGWAAEPEPLPPRSPQPSAGADTGTHGLATGGTAGTAATPGMPPARPASTSVHFRERDSKSLAGGIASAGPTPAGVPVPASAAAGDRGSVDMHSIGASRLPSTSTALSPRSTVTSTSVGTGLGGQPTVQPSLASPRGDALSVHARAAVAPASPDAVAHVRRQVLELLTVVTTCSVAGHAMVLDALEQFRVAFDEPVRYATLVSVLDDTSEDNWQLKVGTGSPCCNCRCVAAFHVCLRTAPVAERSLHSAGGKPGAHVRGQTPSLSGRACKRLYCLRRSSPALWMLSSVPTIVYSLWSCCW